MERRALRRKSVEVNAYLPRPGGSALRCAVSDISGKGFFLKTNPIFLPRNRRLTLMFVLHLRSSSIVRLRRVCAVVARSDAGGVGMVFCGDNERRSLRSRVTQD